MHGECDFDQRAILDVSQVSAFNTFDDDRLSLIEEFRNGDFVLRENAERLS